MDPNSLNDLLSNPDTLNEMKNMMNDPNIMNQMNQMMSDPNMMSNIMNMMGGGLNPGANLNNSNDSNSEDNFDNEQDYQDKVGDLDLNGLNDLENVDIGRPIRETLYIENDNVLDKIKKKELIDSFNNIQKYVLTGIFGITLIGTAFYSNEKQVQYGGSFNYAKFFFD